MDEAIQSLLLSAFFVVGGGFLLFYFFFLFIWIETFSLEGSNDGYSG